MLLGTPRHSVTEDQVGGFAPANHYTVAGRKETESEWYEVVVNVRVPEATERRHLDIVMAGDTLTLQVKDWMTWERRLHQRLINWEDGHTSATHVDMSQSTWILTRDEAGDKVVQFTLAEWMEGANKNQTSEVQRQLKSQKGKHLCEDADPFYLYDLVEAEMFLRAGAVFKSREASWRIRRASWWRRWRKWRSGRGVGRRSCADRRLQTCGRTMRRMRRCG